MGSEGGGCIETCLFPWNKDTLPTAEDIFALYHFNPNMHEGLVEDHKYDTEEGEGGEDSDNECSDQGPSWMGIMGSGTHDAKEECSCTTFFNWLQKLFPRVVRIGVGAESMNPIPLFILAKIAPGWVGGVLTVMIYT